MYRIELHCHTNHTSKCGRLTAEETARGYRDAGYSGIVVTDHYNRDTVAYMNIDVNDPADVLKKFLLGYEMMKEAGEKYGLRVYRGAELRFDECVNDYILLNWKPELLGNMGGILPMSIVEFSRLARREAPESFLYQAHPYREKCTPAIACYLEGIEILNTSPRHDSRDALAKEYAERHGLIGLAGSDCHRTEDIGRSGILTETLPKDEEELTALIRSGQFSVIEPEN